MRMDGRMDDGWKTLWYVFYYCINCLDLAIYLFKYVSVKIMCHSKHPVKLFLHLHIFKKKRKKTKKKEKLHAGSPFPLFLFELHYPSTNSYFMLGLHLS